MIKDKNLKTTANIKNNEFFICDNCNFTIDLNPIKNQIETQLKKKVIFK